MPDIEGEKPDFDESDLPGNVPEELNPLDLDAPDNLLEEPGQISEPTTSDDAELGQLAEAGEPAGSDTEEPAQLQPAEVEKEPSEKQGKLPPYVEWGIVGAVCAGILGSTYFAVASTGGVFFWCVLSIYLLAMFLVAYVLWKTRETCTPYQVMLALSLLAVLTAILCVVWEMKAYDYDIKAEGAKQRAAVPPRVQFGPAATTAVDCPTDVQFNSIAGAVAEVSGSPCTIWSGHCGSGRS